MMFLLLLPTHGAESAGGCSAFTWAVVLIIEGGNLFRYSHEREWFRSQRSGNAFDNDGNGQWVLYDHRDGRDDNDQR